MSCARLSIAPVRNILQGASLWMVVIVGTGCAATAGGASGPAPPPSPAVASGASATAAAAATPGADSAARPPSAAPPAPAAAARDGRPPLEMTNVSEKAWLASVREKLGQRLAVDPAEIRFSPSKRLAVVVRSRLSSPRRHQLVVADVEGKVKDTFRPIAARASDEPPKDLRFLGEDSLIYEVVKPAPAPPPAKPARARREPRAAKSPRRAFAGGKRRGPDGARGIAAAAAPSEHAAPPEPDPPARLFVIQPLGGRKRAIRCEGIHFSWNPPRTHLVSLNGPPAKRWVAVDGVKVFPRRGHTQISGPPAWSKDGVSLAFVEARATKPARLVLLAEFDNPTGDTFWDLPMVASLAGAQAHFTSHDRLVVGKSVLKPIFAAPFVKEKPRTFEP